MAKEDMFILKLQSGTFESIFTKNMNALKTKDLSLYQRVAALDYDPDYQIARDNERSPYNLVIISKNTAYYDVNRPITEAMNDVDTLSLKKARFAVILGMGLGYESLHFMNRYYYDMHTRLMLIVEKDIQIFKRALMATDLTSLILNNDVSFLVGCGMDECTRFLVTKISSLDHLFMLKCVGVIPLTPALNLYGDYYKEFMACLKKNILYKINLYGDSPQDSLIGEKHMFINMNNILDNPGINLLKGKFKGKPAIICASGPSLAQHYDLLRTIQDKAVILCAESTYRGLHAASIKPHMACTLERDPDRGFGEFASEEEAKDTYLLSCPVVPNKMYRTYKGPHLIAFRNFAHFQWLPIERGIYNIRRSAANMAFETAMYMGCDPIILVGQDLCYERETGKSHSEETSYLSEAFKNKRVTIPANDGGVVEAAPSWLWFLEDYELDLLEYKGVCINTSKSGALIKGAAYMSLEDAIAKYITPKTEYFPLAEIRKHLASFDASAKERDKKAFIKLSDSSIVILDGFMEKCKSMIEYVGQYEVEFCEIYQSQRISGQQKQKVRRAYDKLMPEYNAMLRDNTFFYLVMHVVQSYLISYEINAHSKIDDFEIYEIGLVHYMLNSKKHFATLANMIALVKTEIEAAGEKVK